MPATPLPLNAHDLDQFRQIQRSAYQHAERITGAPGIGEKTTTLLKTGLQDHGAHNRYSLARHARLTGRCQGWREVGAKLAERPLPSADDVYRLDEEPPHIFRWHRCGLAAPQVVA